MNRVLLLLVLGACTNETTPEGFEGYVYHTPLVFGKAYFVGAQTGPTSTGLVWRQYVINVDIRPKNYTEEFHILSRDNLNVGFQAQARISIRPGTVRRLVESYGSGDPVDGDVPEWYARVVRQRYRATVFDVVHKYDAYDVQIKTQEIAADILQRLRDSFDETPIEFETISIGNLSYPEEINAEIQRKLAAEQDLERMDRERQIAEQEAEIMITTARGRAAAQRIVNETLTPLYVQHEMLEGFRRLSRSDRVTIVAAPTSDSTSPVVLSLQNQ
jgi:regulator of protease activity HflC (stomatin/prohibitin superfamily)